MMWKRLNHDLLMLTRDGRARVRLAGVWGSGQVFAQGREDALVLLPETIPFLAEAMEDGDAEVEQQTNVLVRKLEELSGESLQEFLTR
jgi:U3 small nucleolar RNA-associated protein 10